MSHHTWCSVRVIPQFNDCLLLKIYTCKVLLDSTEEEPLIQPAEEINSLIVYPSFLGETGPLCPGRSRVRDSERLLVYPKGRKIEVLSIDESNKGS